MFDMVPNMPRVLSEYGKVLNMQAFHGVLNIPEYTLAEFCMYLRY